ncbi:hypothetical protein DENSPDRAFT_842999 [Dentipellis sp. KUC8613]|nr:hypothetical protein DENSPDRAFT_842999 [Dentipellis sp. KUC8613]
MAFEAGVSCAMCTRGQPHWSSIAGMRVLVLASSSLRGSLSRSFCRSIPDRAVSSYPRDVGRCASLGRHLQLLGPQRDGASASPFAGNP